MDEFERQPEAYSNEDSADAAWPQPASAAASVAVSAPANAPAAGSAKRRNTIIAVVVAAVCVVALLCVLAFAVFGHSSVRAAGAWPNFRQLAGLVEDPDAFFEAANVDGLAHAYAKRDFNDDGFIAVDIDIDEIDAHVAQLESLMDGGDASGLLIDVDVVNPQFVLDIDSAGNILSFGISYSAELTNDLSDYADAFAAAVAWSKELEVAGSTTQDDLRDIANLWADSHGQEYLTDAWLDGTFEAYLDYLSDACDARESLVDGYIRQPNSILPSIGASSARFADADQWSATCSWRKAYMQFLSGYAKLLGNGLTDATLYHFSGNVNVSKAELGKGLVTLANVDESTFIYILDDTDDNVAGTVEDARFWIVYDTDRGALGDTLLASYQAGIADINEDSTNVPFANWWSWNGSFEDDSERLIDFEG